MKWNCKKLNLALPLNYANQIFPTASPVLASCTMETSVKGNVCESRVLLAPQCLWLFSKIPTHSNLCPGEDVITLPDVPFPPGWFYHLTYCIFLSIAPAVILVPFQLQGKVHHHNASEFPLFLTLCKVTIYQGVAKTSSLPICIKTPKSQFCRLTFSCLWAHLLNYPHTSQQNGA